MKLLPDSSYHAVHVKSKGNAVDMSQCESILRYKHHVQHGGQDTSDSHNTHTESRHTVLLASIMKCTSISVLIWGNNHLVLKNDDTINHLI